MRSFPAVIIAFMVFVGVVASPATADPPRLRVSDNGRFLEQSNGKPFFWMGDTNWHLYKLTRAQIREYLNDRRSREFNVIQGPVLLRSREWVESTSAYGETNSDPDEPNERWFEHIDYIVDAAASRNMYVALVVVWGDDPVFETSSQARKYGKWLGQRYRNRNNVVWIVAGEYLILGEGNNFIWSALGNGLKDGCDGRHLITIHGSHQTNRQSSSIVYHGSSWLDFNMIQSSQSGDTEAGADNYELIREDRQLDPVKPVIDGEAHYEQLFGWDAFGVRRRAYWSVFAGAFGHTYGANGVWGSYRGGNDDDWGSPQDTWREALDYPGAGDMKWLRRLVESRPMLHRGPGQSMLLQNDGDPPSHIHVSRGSGGRYAMIYVPERNKRIRIDMTRISGSQAKAWWFDPRNGQVTSIGTYSTSGTREFVTPNHGEDWVLVLDDKSRGYDKPGRGGPLK